MDDSSVPFENQPDSPMYDWIMALEVNKIAIIQLGNKIDLLFLI